MDWEQQLRQQSRIPFDAEIDAQQAEWLVSLSHVEFWEWFYSGGWRLIEYLERRGQPGRACASPSGERAA